MISKLRRLYYLFVIIIMFLAINQGYHIKSTEDNISKQEDKTLETIQRISNEEPQKVYVSGKPVGIYLKTDGILVLNTQEVECGSGETVNPCQNKLKSGDYILKFNETKIKTKAQFVSLIQKNKEKDVILTISRKGEESQVKVKPVYNPETKTYQIGAWLRNNTQGIGTITYITQTGEYGALGHCISDYDLGVSMELKEGYIYKASISSILKGESGSPGEAIGSIDYSPENYIGTITGNTDFGIRGNITNHVKDYETSSLMEIARPSAVKGGKALIRTSISGEVKDYSIKLTKNKIKSRDGQKALVVEITDENLLKLTGGIVQGLSGSPIIQDGKLVGAVTHVLVEDSSKGYGIFAWDMIK